MLPITAPSDTHKLNGFPVGAAPEGAFLAEYHFIFKKRTEKKKKKKEKTKIGSYTINW
jgi:hypothetical protein